MDDCAENGIYVYIDMHQDLYSGFGNGPGDGAPEWATLTDGKKYSLPKAVWAEGYFWGKAVHSAFDNFWNNKKVYGKGLQDCYFEMWQHVAFRFKEHPALFGFDLMNEPFLGSDGGKVFRKLIGSLISTTLTDKRISKKQLIKDGLSKERQIHVLDLYPGEIFKKITAGSANIVKRFDEEKYMPFILNGTKAIRQITDNGIIFIENCYYSNLGIPCHINPIYSNGRREPKQAFSPHGYDLMVDTPMYKYADNSRVGTIFEQRKQEQGKLQIPVLVGEWGGNSEGTEWLPHVEFLLDTFANYKWSYTYWHYYKEIFDSPLMKVLCRPYPIAVCGNITSYSYDKNESCFTLEYNQEKTYDAPSEIYCHDIIKSVETDGDYHVDKLENSNASVLKIIARPGMHTVIVHF